MVLKKRSSGWIRFRPQSRVLIWGVEFGDKVEGWREEVERGSCSLMCTFGLVCGDCNEMQSKYEIRGKISWRGESDGRKRDLKLAVVVTNGLSRRTMAEEKRGWTSSGRRARVYGVERARRERTGPANGWKLGYPPSRGVRTACRKQGPAARQGSEICGQSQRRALRPKSKPNLPGRSVAKEAVEATTDDESWMCVC